MDLTLNRATLMEELQLLQGVLERRTTIPILSNVLLTAEGDRLNIAATDLDVTVFSRCTAQVRQEGKATIQGKVFFELVRSLAAETVDLTASESRVEVRSGHFSSKLASLDPADFPTLPQVPEGQGFAVPLQLLQKIIDRTVFAVSSEEGHFQYNAALLVLAAAQAEMVATDGHRLAYVKTTKIGGIPPFEQQLLPRKVLAQLRRLAGGENETVYLGRGENHLAFRIGERMLLSRLLESRFPQYERVLVRDNPHRLRLRRQEFTAALRRVALLASERTHGVQLQLDTDTVGMSSVGFDIGSGEEQVECEYRGTAMKVFVNAQYMIDFFNAVSTEWVEMRVRDADGPIVLMPVDDDAEITECLYVIMPIRL
jgi:DNA polymerase III subunit beta